MINCLFPSQIVDCDAQQHVGGRDAKVAPALIDRYAQAIVNRGFLIVTGGANGIGLAMGRHFAEHGMSVMLADIQPGPLDASVAGVELLSGLHFYDAAKYITMTNHAAIFYLVELSKKWFDALPPDLQQIVEKDAAATVTSFQSRALEIDNTAAKVWTDAGGELISLPADEQAELLKTLSSVGADISKEKPALAEAYKIVSEAAQRSQ